MANVFVSFLGLGNPGKKPGYEKAKYQWKEKSNVIAEVFFAQTAILKFFETAREPGFTFDRAIFLCTEESKNSHLSMLIEEMEKHLQKVPVHIVPEPLMPTDMSSENQWGWFEQLLGIIEKKDSLVLDFTHGMRAVPIVFSSAVGFLQKAKGVKLRHALYAWYDAQQKDRIHPIIDMSEFYIINDWAESVSRLTDDADARKLGKLAESSRIVTLQPLANAELIKALDEMTDCIRNVDVNNISSKVHAALNIVEIYRNNSSGSARLMLDLVWEKFSTLDFDFPPSGHYDQAYFQSQLQIIEVLLEHRLYMQAFTALRECIGSLGMMGVHGKYQKAMNSKNGRRYRRRFAEVFVNMLQIEESDWKFANSTSSDQQELFPWYTQLKSEGIEADLRKIVKPMVDTRNGFDHAWTSKGGAEKHIEEAGKTYLEVLQNIINRLSDSKLFS